MYVKDFMTPEPLTVFSHEPVANVRTLVRRHGILQLPVLDELNRLVGIVTDRDLPGRVTDPTDDDAGLRVADIMTHDVIVVAPGTPITEAMDVLAQHRFGALPVVVGDHVVGLLCAFTVLRRLKQLLESAEFSNCVVMDARPW